MKESLPNYLRSYRQKSGLTQDEIAFLMGGTYGSTITRHEEYVRITTLETAFGYAAIYREDPRVLFAGLYEGRLRLVMRRADTLLAKLPSDRGSQIGGFLQGLINDPDSYLVPCDQSEC